MISFLLLSFLSLNTFAGTWEERKFENEAGKRTFHFYSPSKIQGPRPLLVGLHGCTQPAKDFVGLARLQQLADRENLYLLMPQQARLSNPNLCWNWNATKNQLRGSGEVGLIAGMVQWAQGQHKIDSARIYVFGPSAGGGMTSNLLATYPDLFAAGMVAAGTMHHAASGIVGGIRTAVAGSGNDPAEMAQRGWESLNQLGVELPPALPVMVFHGDADRACNPKNFGQIVRQFRAWNDWLDDGVSNDSIKPGPLTTQELQVENGYKYTFTTYGAAAAKPLVEAYFIHGMGHGWSGGDDAFKFNFPQGPNQTELMWNFFKRHKR